MGRKKKLIAPKKEDKTKVDIPKTIENFCLIYETNLECIRRELNLSKAEFKLLMTTPEECKVNTIFAVIRYMGLTPKFIVTNLKQI